MGVQIKHCTSCGSDQIEVAGSKYLCRPCNIVYEVKDTGTKVLDTDPLGKHEQRLSQAEQDIEDLKKQGGGEPEPTESLTDQHDQEPNEPDPAEAEEPETEETGFVEW